MLFIDFPAKRVLYLYVIYYANLCRAISFMLGTLQSRKWENCLTLDRRSWGWRRDMAPADVLTLKELIAELARTISCGGNMLLNVGPDARGRIAPIFEERLRQLGRFVDANREAIFGTRPWIRQNESAAHGIIIPYTPGGGDHFSIPLERRDY